MGDASPTKTCKLCAENIKAAAKVCPFCQAHQGRFAFWREQPVQLVSALAMMLVLGYVCYSTFSDDVLSGGRSFARHRADLRVLRTALEPVKGKPEFWLTGYVTNSGSYPWRVLETRDEDRGRSGQSVGRMPSKRLRRVCGPAGRGTCLPRQAGRSGLHEQGCCLSGARANSPRWESPC